MTTGQRARAPPTTYFDYLFILTLYVEEWQKKTQVL